MDNIIVLAPSIRHFKGLGMRNLQYEMRICQKSHNKVTKTVYVWFKFLWIFLLLKKFQKTVFDLGYPVILCTLGGSSSSFVVAQSSTIARVSQTSSS